MSLDRRSILKMFGVTAVAVPVGVTVVKAAVEDVACQPALQNPMALPLTPPPGMTYNWKRMFITQDDPDLENIMNMVGTGWKPVPASRHADLVPLKGGYWIEHGGLVLMEKPTKDILPPEAFPPSYYEYGPRGVRGPHGYGD